MLSVQPLSVNIADEELGAVGVWSSVSHREAAREVLDAEVFISKLGTIDGFTASTIKVGKITTLHHEILDDTVENGALIAESLLTSA